MITTFLGSPSHTRPSTFTETCEVENVPGGSFREELLHVNCPLVVTPSLLPGLQNCLLQIHHLHDFTDEAGPVDVSLEVGKNLERQGKGDFEEGRRGAGRMDLDGGSTGRLARKRKN